MNKNSFGKTIALSIYKKNRNSIIFVHLQGYHDVAITFLLVVGEEVAYHVMEILSTNNLVECMQETMEPTQHRLMYLYPIIRRESATLCDYLLKYALFIFYSTIEIL